MVEEKKDVQIPERARFWTCRQTAKYLNCSVHTLYKRMSTGTCPIPVKHPMGSRPMFDSEDVRRYADGL